jgi:hypothetical protein
MHAVLTEAGIEIPYPQRDLHVRSIDDEVLGKIDTAASKSRTPP